ncbi:DNA-directed RNA polymerase subunit alpha [Patescibacteria group bacterium]|nr:DNA-directed RNA polymerase subunit alpha [Patescibacteria group bacterium]
MLLLSKQPKVLEKKDNRGVFEVEALSPGYGTTVGNGLRRVLLSSLEGAAVTRVKIEDVKHEFSTIPGVYEDVIGILLNLKQMRFRVYSEEPQTGTLKVKGEKKVTGADFKFSSGMELVNPDVHIAELVDKKAELAMEVVVEKGTGYEFAEARKKSKEEIGGIALDAAFSPVRRVSYRVENMRVGERTDFDRLTVEVETDGSISPETAFHQAADILVKQFTILKDGVQPAEPAKASAPKKKAVPAKKKAAPKAKTKKKTAKA